jgi:uncharacterized protein
MSLPARISIVTLGVRDIARARGFYEALGWHSSSASTNEICWFHTADSALGLFRLEDLAEDARVPVPDGQGFRGVTLAVNVAREDEVAAGLASAQAAGATILKEPERLDWGGVAGYFADPDGHVWEVCFNPHFPIAPGGRLELPR